MLSRKITAQEEFHNKTETIGTRSEVPAKENIILLRRLERLLSDKGSGVLGLPTGATGNKKTMETLLTVIRNRLLWREGERRFGASGSRYIFWIWEYRE